MKADPGKDNTSYFGRVNESVNEMEKVLAFGGGLQTTALAILISERKIEVDALIFADTGGEKPETYYYIDNYIKPLMASCSIEFLIVSHQETLYDYCWRRQDIPSIKWRWCTDRFKVRPIHKVAKDAVQYIGFSTDEAHRAERHFARVKVKREFPLIDMGLSATDCHRIISNYGWPRPVKSSCFFCCYSRMADWIWLKNYHRELFQKAFELEENWYKKRPMSRDKAGLLQGQSLKRLAEGQQIYLPFEAEYSCYFGYCGH